MASSSGKNNVCKCDCHKDELVVIHFMPCCDLTYRKYINTDGKIDMDRLEKSTQIIKQNRYCNDCGDFVGEGCDNEDCKDFKPLVATQ